MQKAVKFALLGLAALAALFSGASAQQTLGTLTGTLSGTSANNGTSLFAHTIGYTLNETAITAALVFTPTDGKNDIYTLTLDPTTQVAGASSIQLHWYDLDSHPSVTSSLPKNILPDGKYKLDWVGTSAGSPVAVTLPIYAGVEIDSGNLHCWGHDPNSVANEDHPCWPRYTKADVDDAEDERNTFVILAIVFGSLLLVVGTVSFMTIRRYQKGGSFASAT